MPLPFSPNTLPSWIRWVAQDKSGTWWGYEAEPNQGDISWYENEVGQIIKLQGGQTNPQWLSTLTKIKS